MSTIKPLSTELQKVAIEELGEVPTRIPEDLQALKDWLLTQPHLEKAKRKIDSFHTLKTRYKDLFSITNVDDSEFRRFQNTG